MSDRRNIDDGSEGEGDGKIMAGEMMICTDKEMVLEGLKVVGSIEEFERHKEEVMDHHTHSPNHGSAFTMVNTDLMLVVLWNPNDDNHMIGIIVQGSIVDHINEGEGEVKKNRVEGVVKSIFEILFDEAGVKGEITVGEYTGDKRTKINFNTEYFGDN